MYKSKLKGTIKDNSNPVSTSGCTACGYGCGGGCMYTCEDDCSGGCSVTCGNDACSGSCVGANVNNPMKEQKVNS
jgi:hypothetical protein